MPIQDERTEADRATPRRALRQAKPRRGDEREQALLATAERLLTEGTFDTTSVLQIAAASGVSRQGFYFYFASKISLVATLIAHTLDAIVQPQLADAASVPVGPREMLRGELHAGAELWCEHRAVMVASTELSHSEPAIRNRIAALEEVMSAATADHISAGHRIRDRAHAEELATVFCLMPERGFYELARLNATCEALHARADLILEIWCAAAGLDDAS
jgi:TetR/AcrR family transcriptional regulator, ethionamide resistance regulator